MPGVAMHVLNTNQLLVGVDLHKTLPPPLLPFLPHVIVWQVGLSQQGNLLWSAQNTSKASSPESGQHPVRADSGYTVGRTHDAGPHLGHIMPNILLPLIILGSASKHEFGSGSVKVPGGSDLAIGIAYVLNINLNCWDFPCPPTPSGMSICAESTVFAGVTPADIRRGIAQMAVDIAISWMIAGVCTVVGNRLGGGTLRTALSDAFKNQTGRLGQIFARYRAGEVAREVRNAYHPRSWVLPHAVGSPVGNSGVPLVPGPRPQADQPRSNLGGGGLYSGVPGRQTSAGARVDRAIDGLYR